ncbi:MAG: branched chain amino acid aminotransferase, partial [Cyclonatronaceae bacterium]
MPDTSTQALPITRRVPVQKLHNSRLSSVDFDTLKFGDVFADHMYELRYEDGAWQQGRIMPYGPIQMMPSSNILHYGQGVFEGMKAFKYNDGSINIFRLEQHHKRITNSCRRMNIPELPYEVFHDAVLQLVD